MKIYFEFPNIIECLEIDLLDNPAIKSWSDHFRPRLRTISFVQIQNDFSSGWPWDENKLKSNLKIIKDNLDKLSQLGYTYGSLPTDVSDLTRSFTNTLHRFFTHTQRQINFNSVYSLEDARHITSLLQDINFYVHDIEKYLPGVIPFSDPIEEICMYVNQRSFDSLPWWHMEEQHRQYHTPDHCDVIFGEEILGKSILRSYIDGDDPNDWDTTGHYDNAGCLLISPSNARQNIYRSDDFKKWLSDHGMSPETTCYDFPVGNVRNKDLIFRIADRLKENGGVPIATTYIW